MQRVSARRVARVAVRPLTAHVPVAWGSITHIRTSDRQVVLTYDDGPQPGTTDSIIRILAERGASATFFMLVTRARRNRQLVRDVLSGGHEVALHGPDHRRLTSIPYRDVIIRTRDAKAELEDLAGAPVRFFRPPYGAQSPLTRHAVHRAGLMPVMWSGTTWDWKETTHEQRIEKAMSGTRPGAILLAHDGYADSLDGAHDAPAPTIDRAQLATALLDALESRDFVARSLSQALASGTPVTRGVFSR
jgi:peptidoglycan/xylan/chitin deacetylase (PgdA/CDA1 family)